MDGEQHTRRFNHYCGGVTRDGLIPRAGIRERGGIGQNVSDAVTSRVINLCDVTTSVTGTSAG